MKMSILRFLNDEKNAQGAIIAEEGKNSVRIHTGDSAEEGGIPGGLC